MAEVKENLIIKRLSGGVTNANYVMQDGENKYVIRIAGRGTEKFIDRANEFRNVSAMAKLGIAPRIYFSDTDTGFQIQEFVHGETLTEEKIRENPDLFSACVCLLRRCHTSGADFQNQFDPGAETEKNLQLLADSGWQKYYPDWEDILAFCRRIYRDYQKSHPPLCPCHNDTVAGNFMGSADNLKLIDWEYSGKNDPFYDLACFSMENHFSGEMERNMLRMYEEREPDTACVRRFLSMKIITALYWSVWSLLQIRNGKDENFYYPYGLERYQTIRESRDRSDRL